MCEVIFEASVSFFDGVVQGLVEQGNGLVGSIDLHIDRQRLMLLIVAVVVVVLRVHLCHRRGIFVVEGRERTRNPRRPMMLARCRWRRG